MKPRDPGDEIDRLIMQLLRDHERFGDKLDDLATRLPRSQGTVSSDLSLQKHYREYAANGAKIIEMVELQDGKTKVVIDHIHSFKLTTRLSEVMELLIEDDGTSVDRFISWKSREYLRKRLGPQGCPINDSALSSLVFRLRAMIEKDSIFPSGFIQVSRRKGIRFALQREIAGHEMNGTGSD